jgi:hypothetical protein
MRRPAAVDQRRTPVAGFPSQAAACVALADAGQSPKDIAATIGRDINHVRAALRRVRVPAGARTFLLPLQLGHALRAPAAARGVAVAELAEQLLDVIIATTCSTRCSANRRPVVAKAKAHPGQLGFVFDPPPPATGRGVPGRARAAHLPHRGHDPQQRQPVAVIAARVSELLDEPVSKEMLDAYASPAREEHKVPMSRGSGARGGDGAPRPAGPAAPRDRRGAAGRRGGAHRAPRPPRPANRTTQSGAPADRRHGSAHPIGGMDGKPGD